jgi:Family of unknown function (DUF5677)
MIPSWLQHLQAFAVVAIPAIAAWLVWQQVQIARVRGSKVRSNSTKLSFIRGHYLYGVIDKEIFPRVTGTEQTNNPIAKVGDLFLRKATKTLDAMCVLCEVGFAEDALVLGRTIFELAVHLRSIVSPDSLEQRRLKAECFIYDGDRQRVAKLNELAKLKQQGKCHSWITGIESKNPVFETIPIPKNFVRPKNLKEMATELGGEWECWYHFLYWSISNITHPSGISSQTYIRDFDKEAQEAEISQAITLALSMHYFLTDSVLSLLDLESLRSRLEECTRNVFTHIRD